MPRVNTCRICGKNFETEGNHPHRYCPECQAKYKSPKDYAYYIKQKETKGKEYLSKRNEYFKNWQKEHPEKTREIGRKTLKKKRYEILAIYSGKAEPECANCGEKTYEFLAIDHIDNTGGQHRKSLSNTIYNWIENNNYPKIFQVLCHNCNWKKSKFSRNLGKSYICSKEFKVDSIECLNCKKIKPEIYSNCHNIYRKLKRSKYFHDYMRSIKVDLVNHYTNGTMRCACCGQNDLDVLAIDHIAGKGNIQRKMHKLGGGVSFYKWLVKNGYPDGYQVLCYNCNMAKGFYGKCPHNRL